MTVTAIGIDALGRSAYARNYNRTECTSEPGKCGCIHAETALLEHMPRPTLVLVSHSPCLDCAIRLVRAGVLKVGFYYQYRLMDGLNYLKENGVTTYALTEAQWADAQKYLVEEE